jgi:hypothetical protein
LDEFFLSNSSFCPLDGNLMVSGKSLHPPLIVPRPAG